MGSEIVKLGAGHVGALVLPVSPVALAVLQKTSNAEFAAEEFFKASISNEHTRLA